MQNTQEASNRSNPFVLLKVLRPRQWTKNLIALAPLLFAGRLGDTHDLISACLCVVCLCLVSGSIYVANDIKDREADALHPVKKNRPIASGRVSVRAAAIVGTVALLLGLVGGFLIRPTVGLTLLLYLILQVVYNYVFKNHAILDIFSIATGFVLRAVAGGVAAHVTLSGWFLLCTSLGALFLAVEKRRQELRVLGADADSHRKAIGKYSLDLIDRMEAVIVPSLVTSYAIYCYFSPSGQWMLLTLPCVLFGVLRYQLLSTTQTSTGAPEEVLIKDRAIQTSILLWVLLSALVIYDWIPSAMNTLINTVDSYTVFPQ